MSYQVLARKWRPKKFTEVVGQQHIVRSLSNSILNNQIGHAYLFCGTRGVGKTTLARIFTKAIRCLNREEDGGPCLKCENCFSIDHDQSIDVEEIDGASHNGVENIRQLVENVQYLPTQGEYKIYIIDEVHMLSSSAFNALLKTLEEPPAHVVFIFATTEAEKLLETVLSRCQRFDFHNMSQHEIQGRLVEIFTKENVTWSSNQVLADIAAHAEGSLRDALSISDQILSFSEEKKISEEILLVALGIAGRTLLRDITSAIFQGDLKSCELLYRKALGQNVRVDKFARGLLNYLFNVIENLDNQELQDQPQEIIESLSTAEVFWIYEQFAKDSKWVLESLDPEKILEILLKKITLRKEIFLKTKILDRKSHPAQSTKARKEESVSTVKNSEISTAQVAEKHSTEIIENKKLETEQAKIVEEKKIARIYTWNAFLSYLLEGQPVLATNLEQGNLTSAFQVENNELRVKLGFKKSGKVFYDYLKEAKPTNTLRSALAKYFNIEISSVFVDHLLIEEENFKTRIEEKEIEIEKDLDVKRKEFLEKPAILTAENLFKTKIQKVEGLSIQ